MYVCVCVIAVYGIFAELGTYNLCRNRENPFLPATTGTKHGHYEVQLIN